MATRKSGKTRDPEETGRKRKPGTAKSRKKTLEKARKEIRDLLVRQRKGTVTGRDLEAGLHEILRKTEEMLTHHYFD